jgi:predicted metal-binding transcription factor (methanogenesis marker protein 9)
MNWIKPQKINDEFVKKTKVSIENFQSMKEHLNLMRSRKIDQNDKKVMNIKAVNAIETVKSIEEHLKLMKSGKINEEDEKNIQTAIKIATDAAQFMEKIINDFWLTYN